MKKLLLILVSISAFFNANAQLTKGQKQIIGSITVYQNQTKDEYVVGSQFVAVTDENTLREIELAPKIGFFVSDNFSVGIGVSYTNTFNKLQYSYAGNIVFENEIKSNLIGLEVFSRFHKRLTDNFAIFLQPSANVNLGNTKNGLDQEIKESVFAFGINLNPGLVYMLTPKFGIETSFGRLGYNQISTKLIKPTADPEPKNINKNFGLDFSLRSFSFGLSYYF